MLGTRLSVCVEVALKEVMGTQKEVTRPSSPGALGDQMAGTMIIPLVPGERSPPPYFLEDNQAKS